MNQGRKQLAKNRKSYVSKMKIGIVLAFLTVILTTNYIIGSAAANPDSSSVKHKYYKSIEIREGDSLWSIAKQYMGDEYSSVNDYIRELKSINSLYSDNIQESDYLMITYYDEELL